MELKLSENVDRMLELEAERRHQDKEQLANELLEATLQQTEEKRNANAQEELHKKLVRAASPEMKEFLAFLNKIHQMPRTGYVVPEIAKHSTILEENAGKYLL